MSQAQFVDFSWWVSGSGVGLLFCLYDELSGSFVSYWSREHVWSIKGQSVIPQGIGLQPHSINCALQREREGIPKTQTPLEVWPHENVPRLLWLW